MSSVYARRMIKVQALRDGLILLYLSSPMMYRTFKDVVLTFGEFYWYSGGNHNPVSASDGISSRHPSALS